MLSPYHLLESDDFSYHFIASSGISYHVYFLDYSYMFDEYPELSGNVYSFNIDVAEGNTDMSSADERIGQTIGSLPYFL